MGTEEAIAIVIAVAAILVIAKLLRNRNRNLLPPQPPSWPITGHLHLLKKKQPLHRTLFSVAGRYGPITYLQLGFRPAIVVSSSKLAKECLTAKDKIFASRPSILASRLMGYDFKVLPWLPYGPYWRDLRKICTLQLLSAHRIQSLKHVRMEEVSALVSSLFQASQLQGASGDMKARLFQLTFNIILRMVASKSIRGPPGSGDSEDMLKFKDLIEETFLLVGSFSLGDYLPFLQLFDGGIRGAMMNAQKKRDDYMQRLVNDHRQTRRAHEDLIDVLIATTDKDDTLSKDKDTVVKASAIAMITAGTDTSATTIEWALSALLQHPHILSKVQEELDTHIGRDRLIDESDLPKLTYLQAIIKETFRLYPAAPLMIPHESMEACNVGGFDVPTGTRLLVNVWAIHRDPAVWERPTEFDPGRFLKSQTEIDVKGQHFELLPFGSGRRMCPGLNLGLTVVSYALARLLHSFEWSVPPGTTIDMREGLGLTMPKAIPLEAIIKPRLPLHLY
ncbi:hypothetical protein SUGI_0838070 [Cryptomeria japonica]|uniref:xanthotoxin 5-hydroxylase CYP82C4 n=1 Tax=Cryptomeria japonica TaxID=3369 RepID=UPI002414B34C|nr:xanthotoxin 5-hydroxylase CYP82C4 [Cryptomeria japonica]GLJ40599.1 hypothetical protein SUGI_0838070 [Cryptomeria japonica]